MSSISSVGYLLLFQYTVAYLIQIAVLLRFEFYQAAGQQRLADALAKCCCVGVDDVLIQDVADKPADFRGGGVTRTFFLCNKQSHLSSAFDLPLISNPLPASGIWPDVYNYCEGDRLCVQVYPPSLIHTLNACILPTFVK